MNTEEYERARDLQFSIEEIRPGVYIRERDELDAQTDEYERTRDDERA